MTYTNAVDVVRVFNELFAGNFVERVDERNATDSRGQSFKTFYIHFLPGTSPNMEVFNQKMEKDGVVQVMTGQGKWFWKVYLNKSSKTDKPVRKGPRIMTEEDEQLFLQWKESRNKAAAEPGFTDEEMDELEAEHAAVSTHQEEDELMEIADEMFAESNKPPSYAAMAKR